MTTKHLTVKNLMTLFGVSHMAIHNWRKGSETREPLPTVAVKDQPRAVAFLPANVKAWAKKHKVMMTCEPASLLGTESAVKPGPKTKTVVAKDSKGKVVKTAVKSVIAKTTKSGKSIPALRKEAMEPAKASPVAAAKVSALPKKASPLKGVKVAARPRAVVTEAAAAA